MSKKVKKPFIVHCPYCKSQATLVDSAFLYGGVSYGMVWDCRPCDAYVGVHKNSNNLPLGRLANSQLRYWKKQAHLAFDPLWKSGGMSRRGAYQWLSDIMSLTPLQSHIGEFDVDQCKKLIEILGKDKKPAVMPTQSCTVCLKPKIFCSCGGSK